MLIGYELAHIESAPENISNELEWPSFTKFYTFPATCMLNFFIFWLIWLYFKLKKSVSLRALFNPFHLLLILFH